MEDNIHRVFEMTLIGRHSEGGPPDRTGRYEEESVAFSMIPSGLS